MAFTQKMDNWLIPLLRDKSDTSEMLEQKVYIVRTGTIAACIITLAITTTIFFKKFQLLLLLSPLVWFILVVNGLVMIFKRGIKWILYFYYVGYIVLCSIIILLLGGLPNSLGIWGGAFIIFMHALAIKDRKVLFVNAILYVAGLVAIVFAYPYLTPYKQWTPGFNNFAFTMNEVWMCLFLVKVFYDSIIVWTNEAKQRAQHLQELDLLKSKLYANITHEFRTPLTLIRGNAEEIGEHHNGEISVRANNIVQSSDKILFLVNQMLNLSKIEEGNVPMYYIQCDLVAFVRFITGAFQGLADLRKIRLHFETLCPRLIMDIEQEKLEESLANLISNAIKYTPEKGDVFVAVRKINPDKTSGQQVEISVRDTGIGIPENQLEKIFVRFYRVGDNRYPFQEGAGIGLTLVNEYIELMKGSIRVKSRPGKGSEFTVVLPVTNNAPIKEFVSATNKLIPKEEENFAIPEIPGCGSNQSRLLIIEDNRELRQYLYHLLDKEYQIQTAENGMEGIEKATVQIPDIILSDVMMPGKNGYQVCKELKNDFRTSHIPIILLTARADTESRISGMEHGADAYLTKPFNKKELMICLQHLLVQRETLRLRFSENLLDKNPEKQVTGLNGKFLDQVIHHLERNYKNDRYGIHQLYSDMGISRVQLHRKLTALTGQSASNFIRNFRLQKAKKLLLDTDRNVSEIAYEVGFTDHVYFTQSFTLEHGISPTELRESFVNL